MEEPSSSTNLEGLKQQASTALRSLHMGLQQQADAVATLQVVVQDTLLHLLPELLTKVQQHSGVTTPVKQEPIKLESQPQPSTSTPSATEAPTPTTTDDESEVKPIWVHASSYKCSQYDIIFGSQNGCVSHINKVHTKVYHICAFCDWSTPNIDSLNRHVRRKHGNLSN